MSRIHRLEVENVKRVVAVAIDVGGGVVQIEGPNGAGKSSVIDAIMYLLGGASTIPADPIRHGSQSARVCATIGDEKVELIAERTWGGGKTTLKLSTPEGARHPKAQSVLDNLIGELSFDPLAFSRERPDKQAETLKRLGGIDLSALDGRRIAAYEARHGINAKAKDRAAQLAAITDAAGPDIAPVVVADLMAELDAAAKANVAFDRIESDIVAAGRAEKQWREDAEALRTEAAELLRRATEADQHAQAEVESASRMRAKRDTMKRIPVEPIRQQIADAEQINTQVRKRQQRDALAAEVADLRAKSEALTAEIDGIDAAKIERVASAKLPIDGLGLSDVGVTYRGVPFDQCSSAERLRVSVAMGLAMNPKLRVMLVRDGSLLDDESMAAMAAMAHEHNAQIWIERVGTGSGSAFVIEEGVLKSDPHNVEA